MRHESHQPRSPVSILTTLLVVAVSASHRAEAAAPVPTAVEEAVIQLQLQDGNRCDVRIDDGRLRLSIRDASGERLSSKGIRGRPAIHRHDTPRIYRFDLYPQSSHELVLSSDISKHLREASSMELQIYGLQSDRYRATTAEWKPKPLIPEKHNRPQHLAQTHCPVTGFKLGSMGTPVSVSVESATVQLCCAGCTSKFKDHSETYLAKLSSEDAREGETVRERK